MQRKYKNLVRRKGKRSADVADEKGSPVRGGSSGVATPVGDGAEKGGDGKEERGDIAAA